MAASREVTKRTEYEVKVQAVGFHGALREFSRTVDTKEEAYALMDEWREKESFGKKRIVFVTQRDISISEEIIAYRS